MPKTRSFVLLWRRRLCFAGTRLLGAAQGVSDAGSCRARAGQATHAWQPARGAISVHRRTGRALRAVIASFSPPGRRKIIPLGLRALPCHCLAHFCSGSWLSHCLSYTHPPAPQQHPSLGGRSLHSLQRRGSHQLSQSKAAVGLAPRATNPQFSILPSEWCYSPTSHPYQFAGEVTLSKLGSGKNSSPWEQCPHLGP